MQPTTDRVVTPPLPLRDIAALLVKHVGFHEGLYELAFAVQIAVGQVGPTPETQTPGAAFGITGIGLARAEKAGPNVVDAAVVNPAAAKPSAAKVPRKSTAKAA